MSDKELFPQFLSYDDLKEEEQRHLKSVLYGHQATYLQLPWNVERERTNWVYEDNRNECHLEIVVVPKSLQIHHVASVCPPGLIGVPVYVSPEVISQPPGSALPTSRPAAIRPPFQNISVSSVPPGIRTVLPPPYAASVKPDAAQEKSADQDKNSNCYRKCGETTVGDGIPAYPILPSNIGPVMPPPGMIPYHAIPQTRVTLAHAYHQYPPTPPFYSYSPQYTVTPPLNAVYTYTTPYVFQMQSNSHEIPNGEIEELPFVSSKEKEIINETDTCKENENCNKPVVVTDSSSDIVNIKEDSDTSYENHNGQVCDSVYEDTEDLGSVHNNNTDTVLQSNNKTELETNQCGMYNNSGIAQTGTINDVNIESPTTEESETQISNGNSETVLVPAVQNDRKYPETPAVQAKSWSSLFKSKTPVYNISRKINDAPATLPRTSYENKVPRQKFSTQNGFVNSVEPAAVNVTGTKLGEILLQAKLNHRPAPIQPRGLINRGNWCYINATLQALIACPPFYNLLKNLPTVGGLKSGPSSTPVLDSMVEFVHEFKDLTASIKNKESGKFQKRKDDFDIGPSFEPQYVYKMLECIKLDSFKGRQEDAEEFLTCLLDSLHEEMVATVNMNSKVKNDSTASPSNGDIGGFGDEGDEEWAVVGPNKKACITRKTNNVVKSPVSHIFEGQMRSALRRSGETTSCILEPFFSLQLDIQSEKVWTVNDALEGLVSKEAIEGYTCSKTNKEVEASKRITLEELPIVLILHFKRFVYDKNGGCQKLNKKVTFPVNLELNKELMSPAVKGKYNNPKQRSYALFAVVYHDGAEAAKGHYITDVYHNALGTWLRADDNNIRPISENQLTKHNANRVPYLLYYRRCDTIQ